MKKEKKILVQFRCDRQVLNCLDAIAQIRDTTRSYLIRKSLKKFVLENYDNDMMIGKSLNKAEDDFVDLAVKALQKNNQKRRQQKEDEYWKGW